MTARGARRGSQAPRLTIVLILDPDVDATVHLAQLSAQCERNGAEGIAVASCAPAFNEGSLMPRVRVVSAPADASRADLRHLAMRQAHGDIVLLEDVAQGAQGPVDGVAAPLRDFGNGARSCTPTSEWRDILLAYGVAPSYVPRASSLGGASREVRIDLRPVREPMPVMADARHPA